MDLSKYFSFYFRINFYQIRGNSEEEKIISLLSFIQKRKEVHWFSTDVVDSLNDEKFDENSVNSITNASSLLRLSLDGTCKYYSINPSIGGLFLRARDVKSGNVSHVVSKPSNGKPISNYKHRKVSNNINHM